MDVLNSTWIPKCQTAVQSTFHVFMTLVFVVFKRRFLHRTTAQCPVRLSVTLVIHAKRFKISKHISRHTMKECVLVS